MSFWAHFLSLHGQLVKIQSVCPVCSPPPRGPCLILSKASIETAHFLGSPLAWENLSFFLFNAWVFLTVSPTGSHHAFPCTPLVMGSSLLLKLPDLPLTTSVRQFFLMVSWLLMDHSHCHCHWSSFWPQGQQVQPIHIQACPPRGSPSSD